MNQKLTARRLWCLALAAAVGLSGCGKAAGAQPAQAETQTAAAQTLEEDSRPSAGGGEDKKTETVYVNLDASGRPYAATVSDWLHSSRPDVAFTDRSDLENIQNIKGEQQPQREGEDLVWQLEGSDLYYQGTSEKPLPLLQGSGNVYGSYLHGFFDSAPILQGVVEALCAKKGIRPGPVQTLSAWEYRQQEYDKLAAGVRASLDMDLIYGILNREV